MNILAKYKAMKALKKAQNRKGFTLVEVLLVLAVATAIITIGLRIYSSVQENTKLTQTMTDIGQIRGAVESLYQGQGSFTGVSGADLKTTLPASLYTAGSNNLVNAFNGATFVTADTISTLGDSYSILLQNLDDTACTRLVTTDFGHSLAALNVSATNAQTLTISGTSAPALPVTPATAKGACVGGSSPQPSLNSVTLQFH